MRVSRGWIVGLVIGLVLGLTAGFGVAQQGGEPPLPEVAFLATAANFPDALAASAVAGAMGAPVLLTGRTSLAAAAGAALDDLQPDLVVLTGGTAALSEQVEADVQALGLATRRVAGPGRIETAEQLAAFAVELGYGRPVVTGRSVGAGTIPGLDAETLQGFAPDDLLAHEPAAVTEIDQERAEAGGVTPDDDPGFPVTISEPGSYRLTSNLIVSDTSTPAVDITASGVALDLNGYAVRGPVSCTGIPVSSCSPSSGAPGIRTAARTFLHGGTVQGFGGAGVQAGGDSRLAHLIVSHNAGNGVTLQGDGGSLHRTTVASNGGHGVAAGTVSGFAQVVESTVRANQHRGITMCGGTVLHSNLHRNGAEGLQSGCVAADVGYALNAIRANNDNAAQVAGGRAIGCNVIQGAAVCPP